MEPGLNFVTEVYGLARKKLCLASLGKFKLGLGKVPLGSTVEELPLEFSTHFAETHFEFAERSEA